MKKPPPDDALPLREQFAAAWAMWALSAFIPDTPGEGDLDPALAGDALILMNRIFDDWNARPKP
jgi:hypothetical protein